MRSLKQAMIQVMQRKASNQWPAAGLKISVAAGMCQMSSPIALGQNVSGLSSTRPLIIEGAGPKTILDGGKKIVGWKPVDWPDAPAHSVFSANISDWPIEIKTLRIGSIRLNRSRFPKEVGNGLTVRSEEHYLATCELSHILTTFSLDTELALRNALVQNGADTWRRPPPAATR
jgi:hypothetical protein